MIVMSLDREVYYSEDTNTINREFATFLEAFTESYVDKTRIGRRQNANQIREIARYLRNNNFKRIEF